MTQIGRYEVRRELGRGGTAVVYLAYDPHFRRQVAIKVLPRQFTHDPRYLDRFDQEAHTIATLEHQAIVPVYDFGEQEDAPYLVMRFMAGGTLRDRLQGQPISLETIVAVLQRLAPAVDRAHELGIIHRDIKPANILFDDEENCYLSDFGIARLAEASHTMTVIGTPAYMSPEQVEGDLEVDGRADIYALGVVLYELFTGNQPYIADTPTKQMMAHVLEPVPDVLEANPELPSGAQQIIQKAMAKDREERYTSAGELATAVRELVAFHSTPPLGAAAVSIESTTGVKGEGLASQPAASAALDAQDLDPGAQGDTGSGLPNWVWWMGGVLILAAAALGIGFIFGRDAEGESQLTAADPAVLQVTDSPSTTQFSETAAKSEDVEPAATPDFTVYDDFDDPAFDGTLNNALWSFWGSDECVQEDGYLILSGDCVLEFQKPFKIRGRQLESVEARLKQPSDDNNALESELLISLQTMMADQEGLHAQCDINVQPGWLGVRFLVYDTKLGDDSQLELTEYPIDYDRWYDIRLQVDPETMTFECLVDERVIGSYSPEDPEELREAFFIRWLTSNGNGKVITLADEIHLIRPPVQSVLVQQTATVQGNETAEQAGAVVQGEEVEPAATPDFTLYDDFEDPTYDGSYNTALWGDWGVADCDLFQGNGYLSLTNHCILDVQRPHQVRGRQLESIEARMKRPSKNDIDTGSVSGTYLRILGDLDEPQSWGVVCDILAQPGWLGVEFEVVDTRLGDDSQLYKTEVPIDYDRWYNIRLQVDPETMTFECLVDGSVMGSFTPQNRDELRDAYFSRWLESNGNATTLVDAVRLIPSHLQSK